MGQSERFEAGRFHAGRFCGGNDGDGQPSFSVSISNLTSNPSHGTTAEIGVELTASAHGFSDGPPASIAWQWRNDQGDIPGATGTTYVPGPHDDLARIYPLALPSDTYAPRAGRTHTVRYAPPSIGDALGDVNLLADGGPVDIATDAGFAGDALVFALAAEPGGVVIDAASGVTTIDTDAGARSGPVIVSVTNSGGSVSQGFALAVSDEPFVVNIGGLQDGVAIIGSTVSAEIVWFIPEDAIDRIRWRSNNKVIAGERDPTYVVDPSMAGNVLSCTVTTVNNGAKTSVTYPVA
ncbi:hypothetical protein [Microbulbifer sp. S227A]|uniref:hypothetical protein n=1 Tax=Microbulbifer sp. S227A TaxID=3415131 RepID=UPI003C7CC1C9